MNCFRVNLTKTVATWPGAEGQSPQPTSRGLYSTDEIEIGITEKFMKDPVCQGAVGQLVCQYRRQNIPLPSSSSATAVAMLPEFGPHLRARQSSFPTAEKMIPLDVIRDAFSDHGIQGSSLKQTTEDNGSVLFYRHQTVTYVLFLVISAAFHFV
ncbi:hypothetical protein TSMEX_000108 [Taenia solium]|eukprot:TsM_000632000 transcript=TsM_000632000 gene=TsM_000632000